jgi:hypothetical protein
MSDVPFVRTQFMDALSCISEGSSGAEELTANLRAALLDFGSETPDNLDCAKRIEVGAVDTEIGMYIGLKLRGREALLSDVAHMVEDGPMPGSLKSAFPELTESDWNAFSRLTTLIYILLGRKLAQD